MTPESLVRAPQACQILFPCYFSSAGPISVLTLAFHTANVINSISRFQNIAIDDGRLIYEAIYWLCPSTI